MEDKKLQIDFYRDSRGRSEVEDWLKSGTLSETDILRINRHLHMLETNGLELSKKMMKKLQGYKNLYELRPGNYRIMFCVTKNKVVILLSYFKKKSDETPPLEIEKAINRRDDYLKRR